MGNTPSAYFEEKHHDVWWPSSKEKESVINSCQEEANLETKTPTEHQREDKLQDWLAQMSEKRRQILDNKRRQFEELRKEISLLKTENEKLRCLQKENDSQVDFNEMHQQIQDLNKKIVTLETEKEDYKTLVTALKNVNVVAKQMIQLRETQIKELTSKLDDIEKLLPKEKENAELRREYEKQLVNIRNLKTLYEEKQRAEKREKEALLSNLDALKQEFESEKKKTQELSERISTLEEEDSKKYDEIKHLESSLGLARADHRQLEAELAIINQLFSDVLIGVNSSKDMDLDELHKYLEDHHDLLQSIANEIDSENISAMPKALLDLINQFQRKPNEENENIREQDIGNEPNDVNILTEDGSSTSSSLITVVDASEASNSNQQMNSTAEIVKKLPKVWKVLIELLSHQTIPDDASNDINNDSICYKIVETPKGPNLVLSVSQTFIRLKGLIVEKKSLEKGMSRLKELNCHLDKRLQDQQKKLMCVQSEVTKTWHMVEKIQKQHELLHTQEKVLRYELAQKRKLLTELKEELESSREKCAQAKEKTELSGEQWKILRNEFAMRKRKGIKLDPVYTDSAESGFSDEVECSSDSCEETE